MTSQQVREILHRRPFEPFTVVMSSGERFDVSDPENALVTKGSLIVSYRSTPEEELPDKISFCSYLHIASLDILATR